MSNPQVPTPTATAQQGAAAKAAPSTSPDVAQLLKEVFALKAKVEAKDKKEAEKIAAAAPPEIDWTKITEADIFNLAVPIPVYEQETPEYLNVHLLDRNFIPRWIHILPERLGTCLATGYDYVTDKDLDPSFQHPLKFDVNGHYSHGDVVCLKIQKSRYYGAIKRNYLKTMAIHGVNQVKGRVAQAVQNTPYLADAIHRGAMTVYEPGDMEGVEFTKDSIGSSSSSEGL